MSPILTKNTISIEEKQIDFSGSKKRTEALEEEYKEDQKNRTLVPLQQEIPSQEPFPIWALGQCLGKAAGTVSQSSKIADSICGGAFLSAASLCVQGHRNVLIDGRIYPLSEFFLTVATSGDRKSTADKYALKSIHAYQQEVLEPEYQTAKRRYDQDYEVWEVRRKHLVQNSIKEMDEGLADLVEPKRPLEPIILCDEPTTVGLQRLYYYGRPSLGLFSDEAARFFGGHSMNKENLMNTIAVLSKLWDGESITRVRSEERYRLHGRRLASHLMLQPVIFNKILAAPEMREQGIMARFLTAYPLAAGNTGKYHRADLSEDADLLAFWARCNGILDVEGGFPLKEGKDNELDPQPIKLSFEAKKVWESFYESVEFELGSDGKYRPCYSFAKKVPEHAARIAGILETFENLEALEISGKTMERAIAIAQWYLNEALRINGMALVDYDLELAQKVFEFLQRKNLKRFSARDVMRKGPNPVRNIKILERILLILSKAGYIKQVPHTKNEWECLF